MSHLTEHQAWLRIAKAYAAEWGDRTFLEKVLASDGCCPALDELHYQGMITIDTHEIMMQKIIDCVPTEAHPCLDYFEPKPLSSPEATHLRADFCYLMAFSCEDE